MKKGTNAKVLATGFGPFPGAPTNPTAWLMDDLRGWALPGGELVTQTLDVTYDVWESQLAKLVETHQPDAVVAFGLSSKATTFTVETTAHNRFEEGRPDARGNMPRDLRISIAGPDTYTSTLQLALTGLDHVLSDDAGDYICNLTLYRLLEAGRRATFIHVPPFGPTFTPEQLRVGARTILEAAAL